MSAILKDIQGWSATAAAWQQEAMVRLFQNGELTAADDDDLYALLKAGCGIPDEKGRKGRTFGAEMVAPAQPPGKRIQLSTMANLVRVNALAEGKTLTFAHDGITAIYGDNGTGKSGYARVLKKACRARDRNEPIWPNANRPQGPTLPAEATFTLLVDSAEIPVSWKDDGSAPHDALGTFAIFDSRCARSYIDEDGDTAYAPYGMDILRGLGAACQRLRVQLDAEQARTTPNLTAFSHLSGRQTAAGRLLRDLSAATRAHAIEELATLSQAETDQYTALKKAAAEPDPRDKAKQLRLRSARLSALANRCRSAVVLVNDAAVGALRKRIDDSKAARATADVAARRFQGMLPGTGGEVWADLFAAARKFATEAYPGKTFPDLGSGAPCPLCQQGLSEQANERLRAFDAFVSDEAEKLAQTKREEAKVAYRELVRASLGVGLDDALSAELGALAPAVSTSVAELEAALGARRDSIKRAAADATMWAELVAMPDNPAQKLDALGKDDITQAVALERMVDAKTAAQARSDLAELDDRVALAQVKQSVLDAVGTMKRSAQLTAAYRDVDTRGITDKAKELQQQVINDALAKALAQEFEALGVADLEVSFRTVGQRGKTVFGLILEKPGGQKVSNVLSEGEQRAVAIASFLADLNLSGTQAGVVFDDPVSSLDHLRRWHVVGRLVEEAKRRQVVVFTHDLYFLLLLQQESEKRDVPCRVQSLKKTPDGFGVADDSVPFDGAPVTKRIGMLRQAQVGAAELEKAGQVDAARRTIKGIYGELRHTWERAIEEVLFNGAVIRFTEGVATQRLAAVEVSDDDFKAVDAGMTRCSKMAHDGAAVANVPTPSAADLDNDITALETWRKATDDRNKAVRKRRGS